MTTAHFYQASGGSEAKLLLAAQLTERYYQSKKRVLIVCQDKQQALSFDEYLWTFKPTSFIPHNLIDDAMSPPPPVLVANIENNLPRTDVIINLSDNVISEPKKYRLMTEIICQDDTEKERLRGFYRQYQSLGLKVEFIAENKNEVISSA